jgi:hypothetical protein
LRARDYFVGAGVAVALLSTAACNSILGNERHSVAAAGGAPGTGGVANAGGQAGAGDLGSAGHASGGASTGAGGAAGHGSGGASAGTAGSAGSSAGISGAGRGGAAGASAGAGGAAGHGSGGASAGTAGSAGSSAGESGAGTSGSSSLGTGGSAAACQYGDKKCSGNGVQTCGMDGSWSAPTSCTNSTCSAGSCVGMCVSTTMDCSATGVPEVCDAQGTWEDQAACTAAAPTCSNGHCICTGITCSGSSKCIDPSTDVGNCGDCGHACSAANASGTPSCATGTCALTCLQGFFDCHTPSAPSADDGCECQGTACCGSACQTKHNNGVFTNVYDPGFKDFYDCEPSTDATAAMDGCKLVIAASTTTYSGATWIGCYDQSSTGYPLVCAIASAPTGSCSGSNHIIETPYCWGYDGPYQGNVYENNALWGCVAETQFAGAWFYFESTKVPAASGTWH